MEMYKVISKQEIDGETTTIEQVKKCLWQMDTVSYDSLDTKDRLQLADALQVCASVIASIEFDKRRDNHINGDIESDFLF